MCRESTTTLPVSSETSNTQSSAEAPKNGTSSPDSTTPSSPSKRRTWSQPTHRLMLEWQTSPPALRQMLSQLRDLMRSVQHWRWVAGATATMTAPAFELGWQVEVIERPLRVQLWVYPRLRDE